MAQGTSWQCKQQAKYQKLLPYITKSYKPKSIGYKFRKKSIIPCIEHKLDHSQMWKILSKKIPIKSSQNSTKFIHAFATNLV